ncbi:MAG: DNA repair protein RecO C-terminal domain-containing protein, partial [Polyangiales bacterium]
LAHLERVTAEESFLAILRNLEAIGAAGAALAVIRERVPDHEPEPAVFDLAVRFLSALDTGAPPEEALLSLHIQVLAHLGFSPTLDRCVHCGKAPPAGRSASFDASRGGIVCRACGGGYLVLGAEALRRWIVAQREGGFPEAPWPDKDCTQIRDALATLDENHATSSVRERTSAAHQPWEGRPS